MINDSARQGSETGIRSWPTWLGMAGVVIVIFMMLSQTGRAILLGLTPGDRLADQNVFQQGLRIAFLLIALGALLQIDLQRACRWKWAVGVAKLVLVFGIAGEFFAVTAMMNWADGNDSSLELRLFRLGTMAAFAVPMLVLLAACEESRQTENRARQFSSGIGALLVRWEPVLFAIGAGTLPVTLVAAAMVNRELTWLLPVGADTTVVACIAASIRAWARQDRLAFNGWLGVSVSMCFGLLMGSYSFGGPLPTPSVIGAYDALPRIVLRDIHVVFIAGGVIAIALASTRTVRAGLS